MRGEVARELGSCDGATTLTGFRFSDTGSMQLLTYVDEVLDQCEVCRPSDKDQREARASCGGRCRLHVQ